MSSTTGKTIKYVSGKFKRIYCSNCNRTLYVLKEESKIYSTILTGNVPQIIHGNKVYCNGECYWSFIFSSI